MISPLYFLLSLFLFSVQTLSLANPPAVEELYRFPNGTRIANVLVLRNGSLLLTLITEPSLYRFDPNSKEAPVLVRRFPGHTSLLGIAQLQGNGNPIAVIAGNLTQFTYANDYGTEGVLGSFSIFLLSPSGQIKSSFLIPQASFLAGLTVLPDAPKYLLASDSGGAVWRLNTITGSIDRTIVDPLFYSAPSPSLAGIHVFGQYLYFTVGDTDTLGRIRIKPDGRRAVKLAETTTIGYQEPSALGDFAIAPDGSFYFVHAQAYIVDRRAPFDDAGLRPVLKPNIVEVPTAAAFTIDPARGNVLYVVSAGFVPGYRGINGGGQIVRINLDVPQPDLPTIEKLNFGDF